MIDYEKLRKEFHGAAKKLNELPEWFQVMRKRRLAYAKFIEEQRARSGGS